MNAIVGLCHFCEAHGPKPLFCTYTTDNDSHITDRSKSSVQCNGCASIGTDIVFVSRDSDNTMFCSRESVPNSDVTAFLRQAALRSITCEVSCNKEGGVVYFSDIQGHVLSYMFQIKDTRARGLKRMFSVVVLMKDKLLMLNLTPTLADHMQGIASELQKLADMVYENEQRVCSQRALRLKTGVYDFGPSRSLIELTGDIKIFEKLHSHFTWLLRTGAVTYTETLYTSSDLLSNITNSGADGTIFERNACEVPDATDGSVPLRQLQKHLSKPVFKVVLYCTLVGVDIVINSRKLQMDTIVATLLRLTPTSQRTLGDALAHLRASSDRSRTSSSFCVCYLEETKNNTFKCDWRENLPAKCPTLMNKIESSLDNDKMNEAVLDQHINALLLNWLGIANTLNIAVKSSHQKSEDICKLKQILGVKPEDERLISHWSKTYCV